MPVEMNVRVDPAGHERAAAEVVVDGRRGGIDRRNSAAIHDEPGVAEHAALAVERRTDGYHDIESVVAFADCADRLTLTPGPALALETMGSTADACGEVSDNLVLKAARLLAERVADLELGAFALEKMLPVAAGIGGGSADAAAALRLLARLNELSLDDARLAEVALATGADVPVCLASRACDMTGVGEGLLPLPLLIAFIWLQVNWRKARREQVRQEALQKPSL